VPEVEAPEGSGFDCGVLVGSANFGLVPEVDGVGDECGLLAAGEPLESGLGGETGGSAGIGGAAGGVVLAGVIGALAESRGCNLGTVVQLY
jgi:hypothetical protein